MPFAWPFSRPLATLGTIIVLLSALSHMLYIAAPFHHGLFWLYYHSAVLAPDALHHTSTFVRVFGLQFVSSVPASDSSESQRDPSCFPPLLTLCGTPVEHWPRCYNAWVKMSDDLPQGPELHFLGRPVHSPVY